MKLALALSDILMVMRSNVSEKFEAKIQEKKVKFRFVFQNLFLFVR